MATPGKRVAAMVVDIVLGLIAPLLVTRRVACRNAPKVLLIRCDHLGDAVLATSVIHPIRRALAPGQLDVLASPWNREVFEGNSDVDHVHVVELPRWLAQRGAPLGRRIGAWLRLPRQILALRREQYDYAIDLRGDLRHITFFLALGGAAERVSSDRTGGRRLLTRIVQHQEGIHDVERNARIAALVGAHGPFTLNVTGAPLDHPPEGEYIVFGLSSNKPNRRWPLAQAAELAAQLHASEGLRSVYIGGGADLRDGASFADLAGAGAENWAGRTSVRQSVTLLRQARAFLTIDSGQLHLGAAAACPTVALFADSDPVAYAPWGTTHHVLPANAPCGCHQPACRFTEGSGRCLRDLSVQQVHQALRTVMKREGH